MAQSSLYKRGSSTAQTVNVTSDPARDLGRVDVAEIMGGIDVTDRRQRDMGHVVVDNQLTTDLAGSLNAGGDAVRTLIQAPVTIDDTAGNQIDPATDAGLQHILDTLSSTTATEATLSDVQGSSQATENAVTNGVGVQHGQHATSAANTAESVTGGTETPVGAGKAVAVLALRGNAGNVVVGGDGVTEEDGYPLAPGQPVDLQVDDVASIFVTALNAGDGVAWIVESDA